MIENFMENAPLGTKIFDRKSKHTYVKVERNGVQFWKKQRGTSFGANTSGLFMNTEADNIGTEIVSGSRFPQAPWVKNYNQVGDKIPDYLQQSFGKNLWPQSLLIGPGREKVFTKRNQFIELDGKIFSVKGNGNLQEIAHNHKIKKGQVYNIDNLDSIIGKQLKSQLNRSEEFYTWEKKNKGLLNLDNLVEKRDTAIQELGPNNSLVNFWNDQINYEKKYLKRHYNITDYKLIPFESKVEPKVKKNKLEEILNKEIYNFDYQFPASEELHNTLKQQLIKAGGTDE